MRGVSYHTLENGVRVIIKRKRSRRTRLSIGVRMGAADEGREWAGVSHLIEHLLFKSNPHRDYKQIVGELECVGADLNAETSEYSMVAWTKTKSKDVPLSLEIFSQALHNPHFDPKEYKTERDVVLTELHNFINDPQEYCTWFLFAPHLHAGTRLEFPEIGTDASVRHLTPASVIAFRNRYVTASNLVVCAVGGISKEKLLHAVSDNFCHLPKKSAPPRRKRCPLNRAQKVIVKRGGIDQCYYCAGYIWPSYMHPDYVPLKILDYILGAGFGCRIYEELVQKRGIGYSPTTDYTAVPGCGRFYVTIPGFSPARFDEARKTVLRIFKDIRNDGVSKRELDRAKELYISALEEAMESDEDISNELIIAAFEGHKWDPEENIRLAKKATVRDIKRVANKHLTSQLTEALLAPKGFRTPCCWKRPAKRYW